MIRWFLRAFPRPFRDAYGDDMAADFETRLAAARAIGVVRAVVFWLRTSANLISAGLAERRRSSFIWTPPGAHAPRRRGQLMSGWTQDFRFALRRLRHEPGYAMFVALTLALGIGANVAVFAVVDGVLLRLRPHTPTRRSGWW